MTLVRHLSILLLLLGLVHLACAQAPNWAVTASNYQYSMTVTAFLNVNGTTLDSEQDRVGAFVGNEVRGVAHLQWVESSGRYLAFLTIYANQVGETIQFKIYNSSSGAVVEVDKTLPFGLDEQRGNVFQAYSIASPALRTGAEIKEFSFANAYTAASTISASQVHLAVDYNQDLNALVPEFTLSEGAGLYLGREQLSSGSQPLDFTETLQLEVLSEDEATLRSYEVVVIHQAQSDADFTASNVVTANGDGHNDTWRVLHADRYRDFTFLIFDANGRILYESVGYQNDWGGYYQGRRLDKGKYYYKVESSDKSRVMTGHILLVY
ncbi:T9SS type B sorting domain-containing protein [Cesiribacter andamanensis]|nr:gliding motility-associated C-terminal domain-containing protein [Cesiribacter andamanensis]